MAAPAPLFSIEFFPPRASEGEARLDAAHGELSRLKPDFFSVTYGAGGSTREGTRRLALKYKAFGSEVAPHLSFSGADEDAVRRMLADYGAAGIRRLVALRGDAGKEDGADRPHRYASELVAFIRKETGDRFHIEVACYPEVHPDADGLRADVGFFKRKVDAGADSAITQYFYNPDAYFRFVDYCAAQGVHVPIVPGIMPVTNFEKLTRFSEYCGAEIPLWLRRRLEEFGEDRAGLRDFGIDVVTALCERLLAGGAPGLHFYSMNLAGSVSRIWRNLALTADR